MTLGHFTAPGLLIPQLASVDQASAINELSQRLQQAGRIEDSLTFFQAVLQCDYLSSSATEDGVAFPYARVRGVEELCFAAGFSRVGVRWRDGSPVHAVFLMAVPLAETQRQRAAFLELVGGLPNGRVVDAAQPPEQVAAQCRRLILDFLAERLARRGGVTPPWRPGPG